MKKTKSSRKKLLALCLAGAAAVTAVAVGVYFGLRSGTEAVGVYPFSYIGMTEFWGDSQESYGPVTTDKIQTVFLTETQTVTEVLVKEGDVVKKGDLLMTFDTTLSELQLERKRLEVEKEKLQLEQEKKRLQELLGTTPWEPPPEPEPTQPDLGDPLVGTYQLDKTTTRDGTSQEKAVVCWLKSGQVLDAALLGQIYDQVVKRQTPATPSSPSMIPEEGVLLTGTVTTVHPEGEVQPASEGSDEGASESSSEESSSEASSSEESSSEESSSEESSSEESSSEESSSEDSSSEESSSEESSSEESSSEESSSEESSSEDSTTKETNPGETTQPTVPDSQEGSFYVIFRTTQDDMSNGQVLTWEGLCVRVLKNGFSFQFFPVYYTQEADPFYIPETILPPPDYGFGYTAAELQKMINQQRKAIADQEFKVRVAENAYKIMVKELSDGNIYSEIDGSVVSVLDAEEAKANRQPMLKISGGGGFLIRGSVSELTKESLTIGQEVTVNDWNTGSSYPGVIREIGDFPSSESWNGMGNPNATYYPFTVFVEESADLQAGVYASIQYSASTASQGIYLENPFLRTEGDESYVLVRNASGRLEKRIVTLGKTLWGSYSEILSGVTEEDWLAFPYGKEARPGAATREGSLEELYNY